MKPPAPHRAATVLIGRSLRGLRGVVTRESGVIADVRTSDRGVVRGSWSHATAVLTAVTILLQEQRRGGYGYAL